jgi:hypothetical protein
MKTLVVIILIVGIIFIIIGYTENYKNCKPITKIEYRYIPRTFYNKPGTQNNLKDYYNNIFSKPSIWLTYPFSSGF